MSIGLASFLAVSEALWLKTKNPVYLQIYKFWLGIFAMSFGIGVVTGIVLSFEFGLGFARFAEMAGPMIALEVLTAFFLEAGFAVAILTSVFFGLAPVLSVRRLDLARNLREARRAAGWKRRQWTSLLVSAEVALAFVLLIGTGLLIRTFMNMLRVNPGFRAENVFTFRISGSRYGCCGSYNKILLLFRVFDRWRQFRIFRSTIRGIGTTLTGKREPPSKRRRPRCRIFAVY
jgi:hypothetical protein